MLRPRGGGADFLGRSYGRLAHTGQFFFKNVQSSFAIRRNEVKPLAIGAPCGAGGVRAHFNYRPVEPQGFKGLPWPLSRWCGRDAVFEYRGEVNDAGRPHGLGRWTDSQVRGHGGAAGEGWQSGQTRRLV